MNKLKINKLIAVATVCCSFTNIIPTFAENIEVATVTNNKEFLIEANYKVPVSKNADSPITFQDTEFENFIREQLKINEDEEVMSSVLEKYSGIIIDMKKYNITSLEDLIHLPNLTAITIENNTNISLAVLNNLANLDTVVLNGGQNNLSELPVNNVKVLELHNTEADMSALSNLTVLKTLKIRSLHKSLNYDFLDELKDKTTIKTLEISDSRDLNTIVDKLENMQYIENLKLSTSNHNSLDVTFLSSLPQLKSLNLSNIVPTSIGSIESLIDLSQLSINNSGITNGHLLEIQHTIGRLEELDLSSNLITSVEPFCSYADSNKLTLARNYINLNNKDNVDFLNKRDEKYSYPQKRLVSVMDDNTFLLKTGAELDLDFLKIRYIDRDGTASDFSISEDDIEYRILPSSNNDYSVRVSNNNKIEAIKDGVSRVHISIKGVASSSATVTVNICSASEINDKGTVVINLENENGDTIGEQEIAKVYSPGSHIVLAPNVKNYELVSEKVYNIVDVEVGKNKEIKFIYKLKDENKDNYGRIQIRYLLDGSNEEIAEEKSIGDLEINQQTISAEDINGYRVVGETSKTITLTEDTPYNVVTFKYEKVEDESNDESIQAKGSIKINYIDKNTGNKIANTDIKEDLELTTHLVEAKDIDGYMVDGELSKNVTLSKDSPDREITFYYNKINTDIDDNIDSVKGTVTIKYVEKDTNIEIANNQIVKEVPFGEITYKPKEIKGFTCITEDITVEISKENPNATIIFEYAPFAEGDDFATFTLTSALISKYIESEMTWSLSAYNRSITFSPEILKAISKNMSENISITFNEIPLSQKNIDSATKKYNLTLVDTITIESNIPKIDCEEKISLNAIVKKDTSKDMYLYKVNDDGTIKKIDDAKPIQIADESGTAMLSFEMDANDVGNADFIISTTDVKSIDSETKPEENKDELPDTSGTYPIIFGASLISLLAGINLKRKRK